MTENTGKLDHLTEAEIERLKQRNPQQEPLTPRQWEQLKQSKSRPEYSET